MDIIEKYLRAKLLRDLSRDGSSLYTQEVEYLKKNYGIYSIQFDERNNPQKKEINNENKQKSLQKIRIGKPSTNNTLRRRKPNYTSMGTDYSEAATAVCRGFFVIMRTYRELCELIKTYRNR